MSDGELFSLTEHYFFSWNFLSSDSCRNQNERLEKKLQSKPKNAVQRALIKVKEKIQILTKQQTSLAFMSDFISNLTNMI